MSLTDQYLNLLREAEDTAAFLKDLAAYLWDYESNRKDDATVLANIGKALVGSDASAVRGAFGLAHGVPLNRQLARMRYQLSSFDEIASQLHMYGGVIEGIIADVRWPLQTALEMVPGPILDFLENMLGLEVPGLQPVLLNGAACLPQMQWHWNWNQNAAIGFLQSLGSDLSFLGFSLGPAGMTPTEAHATGAVALGSVDQHANNAGNSLQTAHQQGQSNSKQNGCCGGGGDDQANNYTPPQEPLHTSHTKQDLQTRVDHVHDLITGGRISGDLVVSWLQDLSPDDVQEFEYLYFQKYHQSVNYDVLVNTFIEPADRFKIIQALYPNNVRQQAFLNDTDAGASHIVMHPPLPVTAAGSMPQYKVWDAALNKEIAPYNMFVVPDANAQKKGLPPVMSGLQLVDGFPIPGTYTVYVEVPSDDPNQPPHYITYTQQVMPADQLALGTLVSIGNPANWPSSQQYLTKLQAAANSPGADSKLKDDWQKANGLLTPNCVPIPAIAIAKSGNAMDMPLTLYAKPLGNGKWEIIDLTNPNDIRTYDGNSFNDAWGGGNGWVKNNPWPEWQIAAAPPQAPGVNSSWQVWNKTNDDHSLGRTLARWGEIVSLVGFAASFIFAFVFPPAAVVLAVVAGAAGAASGIENVADQVNHGDWSWDTEHWLELLSIPLNLAIGAGEFVKGLDLARVALSARAADGSAELTIWGRVQETITINGHIFVKGTMAAMVITVSAPYVAQMEQIIQNGLAKGESWSQIWSEIQGVLGTAASQNGAQLAMLGLPFLPVKNLVELGRIFGVAPEDMTTLFDRINREDISPAELEKLAKTTGMSVDLLKQIAADPQLQAAMQSGGPDVMNSLYADYMKNVLPEVQAGNSQQSFADYIFEQNATLPATPAAVDGSETSARAIFTPFQIARLKNITVNIDQFNEANLNTQEMANFKQRLALDPEMQALVVDNADLQSVEQDFKDWSERRGNFTSDDLKNDFYRYERQIKHIPIDTGLDDPTVTINDVIPNFDDPKVALRDKELALLSKTDPTLRALYDNALANPNAPESAAIIKAYNQALQDCQGIVEKYQGQSAGAFKGLREEFFKQFNQSLGRGLAEDGNVDALNTVLQSIKVGSNKGSIVEWWYYYNSVIPDLRVQLRAEIYNTAGNDPNLSLDDLNKLFDQQLDGYVQRNADAAYKQMLARKPTFTTPDGYKLYPDVYNPQTGVATDLKSYNPNSDVTKADNGVRQLDKYIDVLNAPNSSMKSMRYLFMPYGGESPFESALANYGNLERYKPSGKLLGDQIKVYYMGTDGQIYEFNQQTIDAMNNFRASNPNADINQFISQYEQTQPGMNLQSFNSMP